MRQSMIRIACLAAWLLIPGAGQAQAPSAEGLTAARELVVTMQVADQFKMIVPLMMQSIRPAIVQGRSPQFERDFDAIVQVMIDGMSSRFGEMGELIAGIYAQNFTVAELREVIAFYRGPTGQKLLEKTPAIAQQSMAMGQKFGESLMNDLQGRMKDELRKRGHKI